MITKVTLEKEFEDILKRHNHVVVHFGAPWCEPCKQVDALMSILAEDFPATFVRIEAEELSELSAIHDIAVVPLVLFFQSGKEVDRMEGVDVFALRAKAKKMLLPSLPAPENRKFDMQPQLADMAGASDDTCMARVKAILADQPVMLLMKGTPESPRCGFSSRVVSLLQQRNIEFGHFDILSDNRIRQAAKTYSDWPTYPQLYLSGVFVGGCDIIEELDARKELVSTLRSFGRIEEGNIEAKQPLLDRLSTLTRSDDVVLFMKGSREHPKCGFSTKVIQALQSKHVMMPFTSYDILKDEEVREGLKSFSQWPTYPQLYAGGHLIGGCDIVLHLLKEGQLKEELQAQIRDSQEYS